MRRFRIGLHRPVTAARPNPHLSVHNQGALRRRRCAGDHDRAAEVSGVKSVIVLLLDQADCAFILAALAHVPGDRTPRIEANAPVRALPENVKPDG